jgi:hypothetical protein
MEGGKEKGVGLTPNQWKQIFLDGNNHILMEVTVLGIFTKMRMRLKVVSWVMTLHHIPAALFYDAASYPSCLVL